MNPFISFGESQFNDIFPFYILVNRKMEVLSIGKTLGKIMPDSSGKPFVEHYMVLRPYIEQLDFGSLLSISKQMIVIECKNPQKVSLRGQLEYLPQEDLLLFIGSPWFGSMEQVKQNKLNLHDFAFHDPMIDLLHVLKTQEITTEDLKLLLKKVNQQKNDLKKAAREIHDIALFPMQNPDPLIRIDMKGNILTVNPAAESLKEFTYQNQAYEYAEFWKKVSSEMDMHSEREIIEATSGGKAYSFMIKPLPGDGYINIYGRDITEQKLKEEQLHILSSIAAENTNGVVIANKDGRIEWVNKSFEHMTGYVLEELEGKKPGEVLQGEESDPETIAYLKKQVHHGEPFVCEILNYHKSGRPYWLRIQGQALKDRHGNISKYFAIEEDITAEKETQQKLMEFESRFRIALEKIGDNVWEHDFRTGETVFSNPDNTFVGLTLDDPKVNDKHWWDSICPEDLDLLDENNRKCRAGEIDHHVLEYRMTHHDGSIRWVLDRGVVIEKDMDDKPLKIIGTHTDITRQKNAEEAIKAKEEKYRNIIANINLGLLEVDNDEKIQYANQRLCEMSGYSAEELIGKVASDIFIRPESKDVMESKNKLRKIGVSDAYEISVSNKNGEHRWWLISGAPNYNDKGKLIGSIGIHLDITEQKKLELELIEAKNIAEASTRSKESFLANMSHEIRTPMNAIMGMSNQLGKTNLNKNQRFYLETIHSSAENLLIIINDILDLSKIEAGMLTIERIGFKLKLVMDRAMQVMRHKAEEKGLSFTNSFFDNKLSDILIGDPYRLNQVMLNLLSNAIKFTEKGGVDIMCQVISENATHQTIQFAVKDTGIGIDKTFIHNLFQKFSQENESITRRYGGTGLGMSISKQLIELMGGTIEIESAKGKGTNISFTLELMKGSGADLSAKDIRPPDTHLLKGKKILVVDDNDMNRLLASTILKHYGTVITTATNGSEAVKKIRETDFDLVLMDVQMPVMNGIEATAIIRNEISKSLPVIALTAYAIKGDEEKFLKAGMNDYLSKPFEENQLLKLVTRWLESETTDLQIPVAAAQPESLYDLSMLESISQGNPDFVDEMVDLFIDQAMQSIKEIHTAYQAKDFNTISRAAHRLKPSIDNMGIQSLKEPIREIERSAEDYQTSEKLSALIDKLEEGLTEVTGRLRKR